MKKIIILLILISISWIYYYYQDLQLQKSYAINKQQLLQEIKNSSHTQSNVFIEEASTDNKVEERYQETIPNQYNLDVQFYPQSPFGQWGKIFSDTCEEASVLIAMNYVNDISMTREEFRDELLNIVDWENNYFWYFKDTNTVETEMIINRHFWYTKSFIVENPSIEDIKQNLSQNSVVLVPLDGKWLNPNFRNGWPRYHFIVLKWYTDTHFISHEVGSKYWENYYYEQHDIMERVHDFHQTDMKLWAKKIIVVEK